MHCLTFGRWDRYVALIDTMSLSIRCPDLYVVSTYTLFQSISCPDRYIFPNRRRESTVLILVKCQQREDFSIKFVVKCNKYWRVRKRTVDSESQVLREKWGLKLGGCGIEYTKRPWNTTTSMICILYISSKHSYVH